MVIVEEPQPRTVRTARGRIVGYYEFGDRAGAPVIALHGTPGSGAGFAWTDDAARTRGLRVIAPDRPGIGYSDRFESSGRLVVAHYADELVAFADALELERFPVLGYSGGAPYALAAAERRPDRVRAAAIVSGAGQIGEWATLDDYEAADRQLTQLSLYAPALARATFAATAFLTRVAPSVALRLVEHDLSESDREVIKTFPSPRAALALFTHAFMLRADGVVADYAALGRKWGFRVENIGVPVRLWHGTGDPVVPIRHSEALCARVPGARLVPWERAGHLAIIARIGEVLDGLIELTGE
ncbi:MAG TPA: alpha/beta hydrolase [Acidimicrobiia bacterium]|nr:alpha/beta hydrolase [Acidimicrobiia bacterium]